jgi:hypothetical protein
MRNLKRFESFQNEDSIIDLCSKYGIRNYAIFSDGSIRVDGSVELRGDLELKKLPLTFRKVIGDFDCSDNNLTTLEGCPTDVGGYFDCSGNRLTSLEYSPNKIGGDYVCTAVSTITSLEGLENSTIGGILDVTYCTDINDILNLPNCNLYSLKGFPKKAGSFWCADTPIFPIYKKFIQEYDYDTMRKFNRFDVIYTDGLDWFIDYDNLGKFLRSVGKEDLMMSKEDFDKFINKTEYRWDY